MPDWFQIGPASRRVASDTRSVLGLFDFDSQGLLMAAGLPRREAICLPPWKLLEALVIDQKRHDLYTAQEAGCRAQLDACSYQDVVMVWTFMRLLTRGLNQEAFPECD